jgi:mannose-6-phosphate isomerase-like protein (cupin superfamily)
MQQAGSEINYRANEHQARTFFMGQKPVIAIDDITRIELEERRPGAERGVLQEDASSQTVVYRIQPGSGVPTHLHSRVYDHFVVVKGELEIRFEGQHGNGALVLKPGGFCSMPPGVRHEVSNRSKTDEAVFLVTHTPHEGYDFVSVPFRTMDSALPFSPRP